MTIGCTASWKSLSSTKCKNKTRGSRREEFKQIMLSFNSCSSEASVIFWSITRMGNVTWLSREWHKVKNFSRWLSCKYSALTVNKVNIFQGTASQGKPDCSTSWDEKKIFTFLAFSSGCSEWSTSKAAVTAFCFILFIWFKFRLLLPSLNWLLHLMKRLFLLSDKTLSYHRSIVPLLLSPEFQPHRGYVPYECALFLYLKNMLQWGDGPTSNTGPSAVKDIFTRIY